MNSDLETTYRETLLELWIQAPERTHKRDVFQKLLEDLQTTWYAQQPLEVVMEAATRPLTKVTAQREQLAFWAINSFNLRDHKPEELPELIIAANSLISLLNTTSSSIIGEALADVLPSLISRTINLSHQYEDEPF